MHLWCNLRAENRLVFTICVEMIKYKLVAITVTMFSKQKHMKYSIVESLSRVGE